MYDEVKFMKDETRAPTFQERIHLCAMQEAVWLKMAQEYEIAEYLEHASAYPKEEDPDAEKTLEAIERESLITNEGDEDLEWNFSVYLDHGEVGHFKHEDDAYTFFRSHFWHAWDRVINNV